MILTKPSFTILDDFCGKELLKSIERAGRTCYKSEDKNANEDIDATMKFVKGIIARGHETVLEHEKLSVRFICDRGACYSDDKGAEKYVQRNWEKGISYGRVYGALQRHLNEFWKGNNLDPEWDIHHLAHAGCCLLFLLTYEARGMKEWDDRPVKTQTKED